MALNGLSLLRAFSQLIQLRAGNAREERRNEHSSSFLRMDVFFLFQNLFLTFQQPSSFLVEIGEMLAKLQNKIILFMHCYKATME